MSKKLTTKDVDTLRDFIAENGRSFLPVRPAPAPFTSAELNTAIKRARVLALLPYTDQHKI